MSNFVNNSNKNKVFLLSDVEVPNRYFERISTGNKMIDELFGGEDLPGIFPGSVVLFTGEPGSGKSTMLLQITDYIQQFSKESILYNACEEDVNMIKLRAQRIGVTGNFCISHFEDEESLFSFCQENNIKVLIQDSLQAFQYSSEEKQTAAEVGNSFIKFAKENNITIFMVGHVNKDGSFNGSNKLKHDVDVHANLFFNKEGLRMLELSKNRFGPTTAPLSVSMTESGLVIENEVIEASTPKKTKKDDFIKKAQDLLLNGEKLSGYSYSDNKKLVDWIQENDLDCSGNWWRGVLAQAKTLLERNGHIVGSEKINRRDHIYVKR